MKNNIKNSRGFTLVELLAVIVVLAIVMVIAVNAVMPQLENARKNTLAIEANAAIDAATTYFMNQSMQGNHSLAFPTVDGIDNARCVSISTLINEGYSDLKDNYGGSVRVHKQGALFIYTIWIHNDYHQIIAKGNTPIAGSSPTQYKSQDVVGNDAEGYNGTWDDKYNKCEKTS